MAMRSLLWLWEIIIGILSRFGLKDLLRNRRAMASSLPSDIIADILCRLPVKDLLRCRSVCKAWRCLIDGHDFIKLHLNRSTLVPSNHGVVLNMGSLWWLDLDSLGSRTRLYNPLVGYEVDVFGSCNGMLALTNPDGDIALWNQSTRRYRISPYPSREYGMTHDVLGFGYDPFSDDYKVLMKIGFPGKDASKVMVYSAKANAWKKVGGFPDEIGHPRRYGFHTRHALHWIVIRQSDPESGSGVSPLIVAFDLATEEYRELPLLDYDHENMDLHVTLSDLGGCLCTVRDYNTGDNSARIEIWVMKEYGVRETWTKLISMYPMRENGEVSCNVYPVAYTKSGDQVLLDLNCRMFVFYGVKMKRVSDVGFKDHLGANAFVSTLDGLDASDWEYIGFEREAAD